MTREELQAIVTRGETTEVEFKRSTGQRTDGAKAVCAMLNGQGSATAVRISRGERTRAWR